MSPPDSFRGPAEPTPIGGRNARVADGLCRQLTRRDLLGVTGSAVSIALAGCTGHISTGKEEHPPATLRMETVTDPELPAKVLYPIGIDDGPDPRAALMDDILDGGATVEGASPPLPEDQHIYYDGGVYVLSHEILDQTPATIYKVRIDIVQETVDESEAVQFSDLPAIDREKLADRGWDDGGSGYESSLRYTHAEREQSALVPESEYSYIVWADGSKAAWVVENSHETSLNTYEYAAEQYATATEYGRRIRDQLAFELGTLPETEAEIVRTAIDERQYTVDHGQTPPSAFWSLADRFRPQEEARDYRAGDEDGLSGSYLVRYAGELYWTVLLVTVEPPETRIAG